MADGAGSIKVPMDLEAAGQYISARAQEMSDELHTLAQQLAPLQETWMGQAASYYEPLQQEWNVAAAGLFGPDGVLGQISAAMGVTWNNYSESEDANAATWRSN
jgi:WXG100 family type VII secretion target